MPRTAGNNVINLIIRKGMNGVNTDNLPEPTTAQIVLPYDPNAVNTSLNNVDNQTFLPFFAAAIVLVIILLLLAVRYKHRRHNKSIYRNR